MATEVIASANANSDNDVIVNLNDYDNTSQAACCPKEIQVKITIKLKED